MRITTDPSTDPADYDFSHRIRVRFAETDAMGIVHHSRYFPLLEEARVAYLRHIGHPYHELRAHGDMAVLEVSLRYRQALRFDELVDVHVALHAVTRTTFQMRYALTVDDEAGATRVRATGVTAHGCLTSDGRPTRLPAWLVEMGQHAASSSYPPG